MGHYTLLNILSFLFSAVLGFLMIPRILHYCKKKKLYDIPNGRKVHKTFVPRLGGVSFMPSMFLAFITVVASMAIQSEGTLQMSLSSVFFLAGLFIIYLTGVIDDIVGLRPINKLVMQIIAASTLPLSSLYVNDFYGFCGITMIPPFVGSFLTVFFIVYMINAFNFIDGIDGLSGCLALLILTGLAIAFDRQELYYFVILIMALMGVITSFLYFNMFGDASSNNKIFMGDSGSMTLGFVISYLCIKYSMHNYAVMPFREDGLLLPYSLLIVPMFDLVRVSLVRIRQGKSVFTADKNHIHHKLMKAGCSQHAALFIIMMLAFFFVMLNAMLSLVLQVTLIVAIDLVLWILFHVLLNSFINRRDGK